MKNHAVLCVIFIFLAAMFTATRADAAAFTMGRMMTVSSDGSLDATRNPSLLTAIKTDNAVGVLLLYVPSAVHGYAYRYYQSVSLQRGITEEARHVAGSVLLSYCRKVPAGVLGFALDTDDRYQEASYRYNRSYIGLSSGGFFHTGISGRSMQASPRFVVSFGGTVKGEHSVGLQCAAGYSYARDDATYITYLNYQPNQKHRSSKRTEEARAELAFGYVYRSADSQAGLMLRSGRFAWQKSRIYFSHADFSSPANLPITYQFRYAGSVAEPYRFKYDRGLGISAGGYHRPVPFIALSLEGEFQVPVTYTMKDLRFDETTYYYGLSHNLAVSRTGLICVRAGVEILPAGPVVICLGGSVRYYRERKKGTHLEESARTEEYGGAFGIDVRAVDNLLIMAGSRLTYTRQRGRTTIQYDYIGSNSHDGLATLLDTECFIGTSYGL